MGNVQAGRTANEAGLLYRQQASAVKAQPLSHVVLAGTLEPASVIVVLPRLGIRLPWIPGHGVRVMCRDTDLTQNRLNPMALQSRTNVIKV